MSFAPAFIVSLFGVTEELGHNPAKMRLIVRRPYAHLEERLRTWGRAWRRGARPSSGGETIEAGGAGARPAGAGGSRRPREGGWAAGTRAAAPPRACTATARARPARVPRGAS